MDSDKSIIKTSIDNSSKVEFKILCVQNELTISHMLEELVEDLLNTERHIPQNIKFKSENMQVIKAYIPKELKLRFKLFCIQKQISMNYTLRFLIQDLIESQK